MLSLKKLSIISAYKFLQSSCDYSRKHNRIFTVNFEELLSGSILAYKQGFGFLLTVFSLEYFSIHINISFLLTVFSLGYFSIHIYKDLVFYLGYLSINIIVGYFSIHIRIWFSFDSFLSGIL